MNPFLRKAYVDSILAVVEENQHLAGTFWMHLAKGGIPQHMVGRTLNTFFGRRK